VLNFLKQSLTVESGEKRKQQLKEAEAEEQRLEVVLKSLKNFQEDFKDATEGAVESAIKEPASTQKSGLTHAQVGEIKQVLKAFPRSKTEYVTQNAVGKQAIFNRILAVLPQIENYIQHDFVNRFNASTRDQQGAIIMSLKDSLAYFAKYPDRWKPELIAPTDSNDGGKRQADDHPREKDYMYKTDKEETIVLKKIRAPLPKQLPPIQRKGQGATNYGDTSDSRVVYNFYSDDEKKIVEYLHNVNMDLEEGHNLVPRRVHIPIEDMMKRLGWTEDQFREKGYRLVEVESF
jgi:hypothetical protein